MSTPIVRLENVDKSFKSPDKQALLVLNDSNFTLHEGEIVALLGKSGAGKSTLLRIIAGLLPPSDGKVLYRDQIVTGPVQNIAMVFQSFAIMPWLTVLENVELGLEAQGVPRVERRQRALKAIDTIGLDGFESAFPRELSGGMRQRVGFARALVVEPELLLMDEPFSALDVLTTENLRSDLLDLWVEKQTRTKSILIVTHDIADAIFMADRIVIFGSNPGHIQAELPVNLPRPRQESDPHVRNLIEEIYSLMSSGTTQRGPRLSTEMFMHKEIDFSYRLPDVAVSELTGLIEAIAAENGAAKLSEIADYLHLDVDDLFPMIELLDILRFTHIQNRTIELTAAGKLFAEADILEKKEIFAAHLTKHVPLAQYIRQILLNARPEHRVKEERFLQELKSYFTDEESARVLKTIIDWSRYAEIFAYDAQAHVLSLENPT